MRVVRGTRFARASRTGRGADQLVAGVTRLGLRVGGAGRSAGEHGSAGRPGRDAHEHRSEDGYRQVARDEVAEVARAVVDRRLDEPNGPRAPVL
ncbi:hypothetical protein C9F11_05230 [Streptomyces sp. YIM 121038]|nr:hypothetical protein C9F11_05230 [Streptomyces sp. YIM 121038]